VSVSYERKKEEFDLWPLDVADGESFLEEENMKHFINSS
jgi:hypothetical protein